MPEFTKIRTETRTRVDGVSMTTKCALLQFDDEDAGEYLNAQYTHQNR
jgi:hypothetical protein